MQEQRVDRGGEGELLRGTVDARTRSGEHAGREPRVRSLRLRADAPVLDRVLPQETAGERAADQSQRGDRGGLRRAGPRSRREHADAGTDGGVHVALRRSSLGFLHKKRRLVAQGGEGPERGEDAIGGAQGVERARQGGRRRWRAARRVLPRHVHAFRRLLRRVRRQSRKDVR